MDIDKEIQQRLRDTEDHFTERKENAQEHRIRETIVAFANSAIPEKPGIIYVGVTDKGVIKGIDNPDKAQKDISSWANSCFPPVAIVQRVIPTEGKKILAVVVLASHEKPHFAKAAYKRIGTQNFKLDQKEIDDWIAYRNSKVRLILDQRDAGKKVLVKPVSSGIGPDAREMSYRMPAGEYDVVECNQHFVILHKRGSGSSYAEPLSTVDFTWSFEQGCLVLLIMPMLGA